MDDVQPEVTSTSQPETEAGAARAAQEAPVQKAQSAAVTGAGEAAPQTEQKREAARDEAPRPQGQQPRREDRPPRGENRERKGGERRAEGQRGGRAEGQGSRGEGARGESHRGEARGERREGRPGGGRPEFSPEIELEKLISDSLYLDNQAHAVVARMRDMDSGTKSQLRRLYNAVRRAVRAPENERQHHFVMLRARLAYTIARHSLRSLDALERLLLQVTRKNDARGYERFKDLFEAIVAYNE
jgi:CRISPR type III-A-associated protein Csm2